MIWFALNIKFFCLQYIFTFNIESLQSFLIKIKLIWNFLKAKFEIEKSFNIQTSKSSFCEANAVKFRPSNVWWRCREYFEHIYKQFLPWFLWFHAAFWRESSLAICLLKEVFTKRKGKGSSAVVLTCLCFDMIFSSNNARLWRFLTTFVDKKLKNVNNIVGHALFDSCPATASFCQ